MIRTIVFDLGKVLVPFEWQRGYDAFAAASSCPAEEVRLRLKETGLFDGFERGRVEPREVARRISGVLGLSVGFEEFRRLWSSIFLPETIVPEGLLKSLRRNHRLLLLSNTDSIHYHWVKERYPLLRHFDDYVLSFEVGLRKPEPGIYRETISRAGCEPGEIFFTDDREENVQGALEAGIDAVQFHSVEDLERELKNRGVNW